MSKFDRLFRPKSIAVIGGGFWGENVLEQCQKMGFQGPLYCVHPKRTEVSGIKTVPTIADLPQAPDAVFVGVNRNLTIDVVRDLRRMGAGGVVCFAAGFKEAIAEDADAGNLQDQLLDAAGEMPMIGPNCYGFINYLDRALLWPDQHGGRPVESGVAIITQSSNMSINLTMQKRGLPIAYMATAGNQAQTGLSEIGRALLRDRRVTALGLHIEGIDDLRKFEELADFAAAQGKRIIALKVGKSEQAQAATISHTASLAGSDAGAQAMLKRLGIVTVGGLGAFLEALKLAHVNGEIKGTNISSMSCSGGEASLIADTAMDFQLTFPPLSNLQHDKLSTALGPLVSLSNPLDYNTYIWGDLDRMTDTYAGMWSNPHSFGLIISDFPRDDHCDPKAWMDVVIAAKRAKEKTDMPIGILGSIAETMPENVALELIEAGITPLCDIRDSLEAIAALGTASHKIRDPIAKKPTSVDTVMLSEANAKKTLASFGLDIPKSFTADNPEQAGTRANEIGFPVVLKAEGIAHKSDAGGVVLNLQTSHALIEAAQSMPFDQFLVEEMITDKIGELLIGVTLDPVHGYVLTLAAGGVMTEIMADRQSILIPSTRSEIRDCLMGLKFAPLLLGYRGAKPANIDAILDAVEALQSYIIQGEDSVEEVEINPLICTSTRAIAADALLRVGK